MRLKLLARGICKGALKPARKALLWDAAMQQTTENAKLANLLFFDWPLALVNIGQSLWVCPAFAASAARPCFSGGLLA